LPLALALAVWALGGLERFDTPVEIAEAARAVRDRPLLGFASVMLGFGLGSLLFVPITVLIGGTLLTFDPMHGFFYALLGVQLAATTTYWCGRALGGRAVDYLSGPKIARFREQLRRHAFRASVIARLLPVGNFTLINWLIGGMRVPFAAFSAGTVVGVLPGLLAMSLFADQIAGGLRSGRMPRLELVALAIVAALAILYAARRLARRL
jgi:phospholipase D1/2